MKRRSLLFLMALHVAASMGSAQTSTAQFDQWFEQVSNHGRWGPDDELGTLNFITPERTRKAAGLVRDGVSISLSRELKPGENPNAIAPLAVEYTGDGGGGLLSFFGDKTTILYHGWAYSHLDALAHLASHGELYNGYPESSFSKEDGASKLGIENMRGGIVTRGVLIDLPWLKKCPLPRAEHSHNARGHQSMGRTYRRKDSRGRRRAHSHGARGVRSGTRFVEGSERYGGAASGSRHLIA